MFFTMKSFVSIFAFIFLLGCSNSNDKYIDRPLKDIYKSAMDKMYKAEYSDAGEEFLEVDRQYPYSKWATKAILMSAFCYYKDKKFDEALRNLEIFVKFHSKHPNISYALYLKALCNFDQVNSSKKDMEKAELALEDFRKIIRYHHNSIYYADSTKKIVYLKNLLAAHEMSIGRFYQRQKNFVAAIDRFKYVIQYYFNTPQMPEAYYRMVESLIVLGLVDEANIIASKMPSIETFWKDKTKSIINNYKH